MSLEYISCKECISYVLCKQYFSPDIHLITSIRNLSYSCSIISTYVTFGVIIFSLDKLLDVINAFYHIKHEIKSGIITPCKYQ